MVSSNPRLPRTVRILLCLVIVATGSVMAPPSAAAASCTFQGITTPFKATDSAGNPLVRFGFSSTCDTQGARAQGQVMMSQAPNPWVVAKSVIFTRPVTTIQLDGVVSTGLCAGTKVYYGRVRFDPTGTGVWGAWWNSSSNQITC